MMQIENPTIVFSQDVIFINPVDFSDIAEEKLVRSLKTGLGLYSPDAAILMGQIQKIASPTTYDDALAELFD